jgi:hypothetical protein
MQVPVSGSAASYSTLTSNILLYDMQIDTGAINESTNLTGRPGDIVMDRRPFAE